MFIAISGISSSGKSFIGQKLAKELELSYIDLDYFYLNSKPFITLSNGITVKNWDCDEALDIKKLKTFVTEKHSDGLLLVGFNLTDDLLPVKPNFHIHLSIGDTEEEIIKRCIISRNLSKNFSKKSAENDKLVVKELVYPFYLETLKRSSIDFTIKVFDNNERRDAIYIMNEIIEFIRNRIF